MELTYSPRELVEQCQIQLERCKERVSNLDRNLEREVVHIQEEEVYHFGFLGLRSRPLTSWEAEDRLHSRDLPRLDADFIEKGEVSARAERYKKLIEIFTLQTRLIKISEADWDFIFRGYVRPKS